VSGFPWSRPSTFYGGVTLGDLDDDGMLDMAASGRSGSALYAWSTPFQHDATRIVHGAYRVNRHNNAVHNLHPMDAQTAVSIETTASAPAGSGITLDLEAANDTQAAASLFALIQAETPWGSRVNLFGPRPLNLAPGQTISRTFPVSIPSAAPAGGYRFIMIVGDASGNVHHWDAALLTVR
jgi:hypothetical protein